MPLEIKGIHYGLTLLYSYSLPLFEVYETGSGFVFEKVRGALKGLKCEFSEKELTTTCTIPSGASSSVLERVLGLRYRHIFQDFCNYVSVKGSPCRVTLVAEPSDSRYVFYAIYLSKNTDYYVNTVLWTKMAVDTGVVKASSYIPREFNKVKPIVDVVFQRSQSLEELVAGLLAVPGVGAKSISALLLHGYGLSMYAPVDRHYREYLGSKWKEPHKAYCAKYKLNCLACPRNCIYKYAASKYGAYNGVVQSLVYIRARLAMHRRSELEEVLVRDPSMHLEHFDKVLEAARSIGEAI